MATISFHGKWPAGRAEFALRRMARRAADALDRETRTMEIRISLWPGMTAQDVLDVGWLLRTHRDRYLTEKEIADLLDLDPAIVWRARIIINLEGGVGG